MGKKRIKTIDLSEEKKESAKPKERTAVKKGPVGGTSRRIVKSGKQHGRIADMGAVMLEEMEKRREEEKKATAEKPKERKVKKERVSQLPKRRSKRYQALRKQIKPNKLYSLSEAIEFLQKSANTRLDEAVEIHLVTSTPGVLGDVDLVDKSGKKKKVKIKTEKKFPLIHLKIGQVSWPKTKLLKNSQALVKLVSLNRIRKAVLTSTMGPGIKVALDQS